MSPLSRRLVWILAVVGLAASLTSLFVHYRLLVDPSYTSFCDISQTVSCQQAYLSRFGSAAGRPVALFGAIWFGFILLLAFVEAAGPDATRDSAPAYMFAASTIGLAIILYLGYAAFFVLKVVCVLCLTTYLAVIGLFIVSGLVSTIPPMTTLPRRLFADLRALASRPAVLAVVIAFLVGAASVVAFFPDESALRAASVQQAARQAAQPVPADQRSEFERYYESLPRIELPVPNGGATVLIVKFTDLQCPACSVTYNTYRPVLAKYQAQFPGAVKLVTRDYPLQPECNPSLNRPLHSAACDAAVAVRLARQRGRGDAVEEWFYNNQALMSPAKVREIAQTVGGVTDFDLQYPRAIEAVKADVSLARILNVRSTPTFFVNGVRLEGVPSAEQIDMAIAIELKKAGKLK
jgi:uncharacterized membrane protein/protein-disulfide isomerase